MGWMIAYYYFLPLAGCDVFGRNGRHTRISMTSMHHPLHDQFEFGASESAAAEKLTTTTKERTDRPSGQRLGTDCFCRLRDLLVLILPDALQFLRRFLKPHRYLHCITRRREEDAGVGNNICV